MRWAFRRHDSSADAPLYLSLLKLHTPPFAAAVDKRLFYVDALRGQYLDMLQHLTQYSEEPLLVVGGKGSGKSALLEKYLERREEHWRVCRLEGGSGGDLDGLFARVSQCFGLDLARVAVGQQLAALRQLLDALLEQQLPVLVVDDADALSDDALEMVFHLGAMEGEHGKLMRLLLFADSSIEERLRAPRFVQIAAPHRLQLGPLAEADSAAYLHYRLQQSGYSGSLPFSAAELKQLHQQSQGSPARLNQAAHELLTERLEVNPMQRLLGSKALRAGLAAMVLIAAALGLHEPINRLLGGEDNGSVTQSAEQALRQQADRAYPGEEAAREGEKIQSSCGTADPQGAAQPMAACTPEESQAAVMGRHLLKPVSMPDEDEGGAPHPVKLSASGETVEQTATIDPEAQQAASLVTTDTPQDASPTPPLVIKPVESAVAPKLVQGESGETSATPQEKLALSGVVPDPVIGSARPQTITLHGTGLVPGSKVAVSWSGKVQAIDPAQTVVSDPGHMALTLTTGEQAATWAVQVSSPDNQRSNILRFRVEAPPPQAATSADDAGAAPIVPNGEAMDSAMVADKPAQRPIPHTRQKMGNSEKVQTNSPVNGVTAVAERRILGSEWVKAQPDGNYTLQLVAVSATAAMEEFLAANPSLNGPFGSFMQLKEGKPLYVLTQGSYPSREEAAAAALRFPGVLQAWPRDFAGIKKVISAPDRPTAHVPLPHSGSIQDTAWVWSQDPTRYTIQLAGASDEAAIEAVMSGISLPGELAVVQTLRNNQQWYTLIYGQFADKAAAQDTVAQLPAPLQAAGPWVRSFGELQEEVAQASGR